MAIHNHIAIITHSALERAVPNRKKVGNPLQFYAVIALPPAAQPDLEAVLKAVAPGGSLAGLSIRVPRNANTTKPIPGVPGDWFVIRAATQFAPYLCDEAGHQLDQATHANEIRQKFYPGKRVRVALSAYFWANEGGGLSFNLDGVMATPEAGERLPIGNTAPAAFAGYADPNAAAAPAVNNSPFGGTPAAQSAPALVPTGGDPFQQTAKPAAASPFA